MKKKKIELDVDYIGSQEPLTLEEEQALSAYFKQQRLKNIEGGVLLPENVTPKRQKVPA